MREERNGGKREMVNNGLKPKVLQFHDQYFKT